MKYYSEQNPDTTMRSTQTSFFNRQTQTNAVVQPKLTVGASNDAHEREADQTADRVMRKSEGTPMVSMMPISAIQRKCDHCEKEEKENRKETGTTGGFTAPPSVSRAISRSGQALDSHAKTFMESRFNRKFDGVQVHTDGEAVASARDISAKAYTSGNHIVFGEGQYQPNTEGGRHLLAHELTHVVQQTGGSQSIQRKGGCFGGKWKYDYDGCSMPTSIAGIFGIDANNPAGGPDTHFGTTRPGVSMGKPCDIHDECYQSCTSDKSLCDAAMLVRMMSVCARATQSSVFQKMSCFDWAQKYYQGLVVGGHKAYLERKIQVCTCH